MRSRTVFLITIVDLMIVIGSSYCWNNWTTSVTSYPWMHLKIVTGSMEPTLKVNNSYLVNLTAYQNHPVERGDVILFNGEVNVANTTFHAKRVAAIPGDTVEVKNHKLYINGEYYCSDMGQDSTLVIPDNNYYIIGDNFTNSYDSRAYGCISGDCIMGKLEHCFAPIKQQKAVH